MKDYERTDRERLHLKMEDIYQKTGACLVEEERCP